MSDEGKSAAFSVTDHASIGNYHMGRVAAWAIFLGMSWTWCIGMYLPVLLLRELGIWGFVMFAVPNVLGAIAMGWVLRDPEASLRMVERHHGACTAFSLATIAFHAFFAAWIIRRLIGPSAGIAVAATLWVYWIIFHWRGGGKFLAAGITLLVSIGVIAWGLTNGHIDLQPSLAAAKPASMNLLGWSLVCTSGFLLCPYLDLTFHSARQAMTGAEARAAFSLGFGVIFLAMILFTLGYSDWLITAYDRTRHAQLGLVLAIYLIAHCCFTVAAHARQLADRARRIRVGRFLLFAAGLAVVVTLGAFDRGGRFSYRDRPAGEIVYLCFMGFYGLVFPSYVWLRMVKPQRTGLRVATVVLMSLPLFWMGFIEHQMILIVPGILIPLGAKLVK
jgi:hypothetical protein